MPSTWSPNPGIYWFAAADASLLYLGKAKNLRQRLSSYRLPRLLSPKTQRMLDKADKLHYQETPTELQALLLEAKLVRLYQPPYNIQLKDDKTPLYLIITAEAYPRVLIRRKTQLSSLPVSQCLGPFLNAGELRRLYHQTRTFIPFCTQKPRPQSVNSPCFDYHLNLCPGICAGLIPLKTYQAQINGLRHFMQGNLASTRRLLKTGIREAAAGQDYESAAKLKHRLDRFDIFSQTFSLKSDWINPEPQATQPFRLQKLVRQLNLAGLKPPLAKLSRLEAYDVTHWQGSQTASAMVVIEAGHLNPASYRHFHLNSPPGDDPSALALTLDRRFRHQDWPWPDLILIDGGSRQLSRVRPQVPSSIPVIGLAKHPDRIVVPTAKTLTYIVLSPGDPVTAPLQILRDEAHRFCRRLHHLTRLKTYQDK